VSENSPVTELPPVVPPPVPQAEEGSPSPACTHPWKPSESKPCPPGHDESGDDDRDEDDEDRDDNRDRDRGDDD
jgi:hypothetical protein